MAVISNLIIWKKKYGDKEKGYYFVGFGSTFVDFGGDHRVPEVGRSSGGDWEFGLGFLEYVWLGGNCLLCFCDSDTKKLSTIKTLETRVLELENFKSKVEKIINI